MNFLRNFCFGTQEFVRIPCKLLLHVVRLNKRVVNQCGPREILLRCAVLMKSACCASAARLPTAAGPEKERVLSNGLDRFTPG